MPTAQVLDQFEHEINGVLGGAEKPDGSKVPVRIALLAGADLIPRRFEADLEHILGRFGMFIVERTGTDIEDAIANLQQYKDNIYVRVLPTFQLPLYGSGSDDLARTMLII